MAILDPSKSRVMETVAAFVIVAFTALEAFITIAPYLGYSPSSADVATLAQQQTLIQTIMVAIISYLFGASVGSRAKDDTLSKMTDVAAAAQQSPATVPIPDRIVPVDPGETVAVSAAPLPSKGDPP